MSVQILTRRQFLGRSGAGALGVALGSLLNVPGFLRHALAAEPAISWNGNKLLFIFLRGGNDSLNMLIPTGDPGYNSSTRPTLFIPGPTAGLTTSGQMPMAPEADHTIDLGNGFAAVHPKMGDLAAPYNAGEVALIHRVGYPNQSRSHFDSQRYWETGRPNDNAPSDGVLYRALVETGLHQSQLLPAVSFTSTMPQIIRGDVPFVNISDPSRYDLLGVYAAARQNHIDAIARMHGLPYAQKDNRDVLYPAGKRFVDSIGQIEAIDFAANGRDAGGVKIAGSPFLDDDVAMTHLFPVSTQTNDKGFSSSAYSFFLTLKYSAQILSDTDAVIAGVELGGFDTHTAQGKLTGTHGSRMQWLAWATYALRKYFQNAAIDKWNNVAVVTLSEFGRTTVENGSTGTDHAEAGAVIVAGGAVNGGVYQCNSADPVLPWSPYVDTNNRGSMFGVSGRYLQRAVDYRSILGELVRDHMGATQPMLDRIIPGYADPAEALLAGGTAPDGTPIAGELGLVG
jgi:uncharacterized protein (DUF1501 family)